MTMGSELDRVLWWDQLPPELRAPLGSPLTQDTSADVAIVGAGYTGLWTAYYLQQTMPGARIAIIEAHCAGYGASGRNGGWASAYFPQDHGALIDAFGLSAAQAMNSAMNDSVDEIGRVAHQRGWDIDWAKGGTVVAARSQAQLAALHARDAHLRSLGFTPSETLLGAQATKKIMGATAVVGGTFNPHCAAIQPAKLVRHLAQHVVHSGADLYENTAARSIEPGIVRTAGGDVRARYVIRATEGYTAQIPGLRRRVIPFYSSMVATEPLPQKAWDDIELANRPTFSDGRRLVIYGQRTADDRLAFGGRGAPYSFGSRISPIIDDAAIYRRLQGILADLFPVLHRYRFTHAWSGTLGIARDWWASVGLDPVTGLGWAGGYVGDGVGTSNLAGRTLAALVSGRDDDALTQLPWVGHHSRSWEVEPLRWLATTAALAATNSADRIETRTGRASLRGRIVDALTGH